jgi:hypothetical protein
MVYNMLLVLVTCQLLTLTSTQRLTSKTISNGVKEDILNTDSYAEAYYKYLEAYTDPEDMLLMASTDHESLEDQWYLIFLHWELKL